MVDSDSDNDNLHLWLQAEANMLIRRRADHGTSRYLHLDKVHSLSGYEGCSLFGLVMVDVSVLSPERDIVPFSS